MQITVYKKFKKNVFSLGQNKLIREGGSVVLKWDLENNQTQKEN